MFVLSSRSAFFSDLFFRSSLLWTLKSQLGHFLRSQIPPIENGPFRLDSSGPSSYRQSSRFLVLIVSRTDIIVFVLFLEAVGVREYCCTLMIRNRLAALCFALSPRATARRARVPASWWLWAKPKAATATFVELHSAESRQSYSSRSRYWQHGIETARCFRRVIHAGEQN